MKNKATTIFGFSITKNKYITIYTICAFALLLSLFFIYSPAFNCQLFFDESDLILDSSAVQSGSIKHALLAYPSRALPLMSYAVTYNLAGKKPELWRITQICLHWLTAVLLGIVVWVEIHKIYPGLSLPISIAAMFLFALHPLAVESGVYIWSRASVFYTTIALLGMLVMTRQTTRLRFKTHVFASEECAEAGGGSSGIICQYAILVFLAFAGMICKEIAIIILVPFFFLLMWLNNSRIFPKALLLVGSIFVVGAAVFVTFTSVEVQSSLWVAVADRLQWYQLRRHLWIQTKGIWVYLSLLIPIPSTYTISHSLGEQSSLGVALSGIVLFVVFGAALFYSVLKKKRLFAMGLGLGMCGLLPYLFLPSITVVEYKAYPLLAGAVLVCARIGASLRQKYKNNKLIIILFATLLLWCIYLSCRQTEIWSTPERVWQHAIIVNPRNPEPKTALGEIFLKQGNLNKAENYLQQAIDNIIEMHNKSGMPLYSSWGWSVDSMGVCQKRKGNLALAEKYWQLTLQIDPEYVPSMLNLTRLYSSQKRHHEAEKYLFLARVNIRNAYEQQAVDSLSRKLSLLSSIK